ncbi:hypothetical protein N7G274_005082 [Stereocaulon virgatum]|uniref:Uncharacterized protein n=1 Tax=Stereocaulon virgatum TaxID=373712 RepID=A0ABR4A9W6_9LECA
MSSPARTISHNKRSHQKSNNPSKQTKKSDETKNARLHRPSPSLPPEDLASCPGDLKVVTRSSTSHASTRKLTKNASGREEILPVPRLHKKNDGHVTKNKAAMCSKFECHKPYRHSMCLDHLSTSNCTANCIDTKPLADIRVPPPAPRPPRLPTPDLSDVEEDELWSCCRSFSGSADRVSHECNDIDSDEGRIWDEMDGKLEAAMLWQKQTRTSSRASGF